MYLNYTMKQQPPDYFLFLVWINQTIVTVRKEKTLEDNWSTTKPISVPESVIELGMYCDVIITTIFSLW